MSIAEAKVPTIISSSLICLLVGAGLGVLGMAILRADPKPAAAEGTAPAASPMGMPGMGSPSGSPGMGMPGGGPGGPPAGMAGAKGGAPGGGGMGGGRGPSPKIQLAGLVTKLAALSGKPLALQLSEQQKKKIQEQLQDVESKEQLNDDDAKQKLDTLLETVKDQRETLEAAGYRWPGQGGGFRPPADSPNPFKEEQNGKNLKTLREQLAKAKAA